MGSQSTTPGDWYLEDQRPSVRSVSEPSVRAAIGDFPKICARIATAAHALVEDNDGGFHTGNCVPLERTGEAAAP
jgi:molecular chaperone DnaK